MKCNKRSRENETSRNLDISANMAFPPNAFYTAGFFESFPSIFMQHTALQAVLRHVFKGWMSISDPETKKTSRMWLGANLAGKISVLIR